MRWAKNKREVKNMPPFLPPHKDSIFFFKRSYSADLLSHLIFSAETLVHALG